MFEAMIILNSEDQDDSVVGFSIYSKMYDLRTGLGSYLGELFIREAHRRYGLGKILWKRVAKECDLEQGAKYMRWTALGWNTSAITFYEKFNAVNTTTLRNLHFYRFLTRQIYENVPN